MKSIVGLDCGIIRLFSEPCGLKLSGRSLRLLACYVGGFSVRIHGENVQAAEHAGSLEKANSAVSSFSHLSRSFLTFLH